MDLVTVFRICFVVGIVAIPLLYLLLGRKAVERNDDRTRNSNEHTERERQGEEYGNSAKVTR
ncbi:MAG: hypothetical protein JOZ19_02280 [Rubrobacter sp.]|nr:hypothetical protein [Rubrobacter sp.]